MKFITYFVFNHISNFILFIPHFIIFNHKIHILSTILSSLIIKDIFFPPFSKYFMYPFICGKIMHNGLIIPPFWLPIKYLEPLSLSLNLPDTTIWSKSTENKSIGSLDLWNYFVLSLIMLNFSIFFIHLFVTENKNFICFLIFPFYIETILDIFFWYSLILFFSSSDKFL